MKELIDRFLTALGDPESGAALHGMHSADAAVRHGDTVLPAVDVDPFRFADEHRLISRRGRGALPEFGDATVLQAAENPSATEFVVWCEVMERREQRVLICAFGLRSTRADEVRVGWCALAPRVERWSYRDGLLQSLADIPWLKKTEPAKARVLLDASYFRQHWRDPIVFSTLPEARFSCQMSTVCCKHDFEITLPSEAQLLIDAMPWQTLAPSMSDTRLPIRPDGTLTLKSLNESCRFLGAQRQCLVHQTLGRQPFGPCAIFPFAFAQTPEGVAVAMSPICGSARLGTGIAPRDAGDDLRERLAHSQPRKVSSYRLAPGREVSWESFRDIEKGLLDCLAAEDLPLRRRLYAGTRLLGALERDDPIDTDLWLTEPMGEITGELRVAIRGTLARILQWDRAALRTLPRDIPPNLFTLEVRESPVAARIFRNTLFSKVYSFPYDLTTAHNLVIFLYLVTLTMQAAANGPLSEVHWRELGALGVHGLLKNVLHEGVPDGFRTLLGTSEFGQWALAV